MNISAAATDTSIATITMMISFVRFGVSASDRMRHPHSQSLWMQHGGCFVCGVPLFPLDVHTQIYTSTVKQRSCSSSSSM